MTLLYWINITGTFLFAISGVLAGIRKKLDLFGVALISFVTALGGGTIRDVLIGNYPIGWASDTNYALAVLMAVVVTAIFKKKVLRIKRLLFICDLLGVAIFSILGLQKSLDAGVTPGASIIFGVVSAIMGGVLRDVLCNQMPAILRREVYATVCMIGGLLYVLLLKTGLAEPVVFGISVTVIVLIRVMSIRFRLALPKLAL